ncbi:hypothetical protein HZR00_10645 [Elizabethkingia anophelis]|nr:hypothetical protein [Elizabethkingia anophelis]
MNRKYHQFVGIFLPILFVSGALALYVRLNLMNGKIDAFFLNGVFILVFILLISLYSLTTLFGEELIVLFARLLRGKKKEIQNISENLTKEEDNQVLEKNHQSLEEDYQTLETENHLSDSSKDDNEKHLNGFSDIEKIRIRAKAREEELIQEKLELIVQYTKEKLALYTTDEDLYKLCDYLVVFLRDGKIENINPIKVTVLSPADLRHFGWNVWNHYRGKNKRIDVAKFLKIVFSQSFKEVAEPETIEKLLTSKNDGKFIKIEENLLH